LSSTLIFASTSSTLLLHLVTLPYITKLTGEALPVADGQAAVDATIGSEAEVILFKVSRLSILGGESTTEFRSDEIVKGEMTHPFSNFEARGSWYFIDSRSITEAAWRKHF
jgi:hypothetical protein